jgi:hypothetical protein
MLVVYDANTIVAALSSVLLSALQNYKIFATLARYNHLLGKFLLRSPIQARPTASHLPLPTDGKGGNPSRNNKNKNAVRTSAC